MSNCEGCGHFVGNRPNYRDRSPFEGMCSLNPVWLRVSSTHFCGQMYETFRSDAPAQSAQRNKSNNELWRRVEEQRSRAITAEKALKDVRAKLRRRDKPNSDDA